MLSRYATRAVARSVPRSRLSGVRRYSEQVIEGNPNAEWVAKHEAIEHHAAETTDLWRKISFFVAVPATILTTLWVRNVENEHAAHEQHIREEHGGELPPVPEYEYLNKRIRPFPWGMNSLFFNPHAMKDMSKTDE